MKQFTFVCLVLAFATTFAHPNNFEITYQVTHQTPGTLGSMHIEVSNGHGPYQSRLYDAGSGFLISDASFENEYLYDNLVPSDYYLMIEDAEGVDTTLTFNIDPYRDLSYDVSVTQPECYYDFFGGSCNIALQGGISPYTLELISVGSGFIVREYSGDSITADSLIPDEYLATVRDAQDSVLTFRLSIEIPDMVQVPEIFGDTIPIAGDTVQYSVEETNSYNYLWEIENGELINGNKSSAVEVVWAEGSSALSVFAQNANGCQSETYTLNILAGEVSSVRPKSVAVSVYPNPTTDYVHIDYPDPVSVELISMSGRCELQITGDTVPLESVKSGTYLLVITDRVGNWIDTITVIKR